jgi:hypothetical protein
MKVSSGLGTLTLTPLVSADPLLGRGVTRTVIAHPEACAQCLGALTGEE